MRWRRSSRYLSLALQVSWLLTTCVAFPQSLLAQMATEDRLLYRGWWPRHSTNSRDGYVGPSECTRCHAEKAATQAKTPMGRTSAPVGDSDVLATHDHLNFHSGKINYSIATSGGKSLYSVNDGTNSSSAALTWSFGDGHIGQSYLFERDGNFYESRMSYFGTLNMLDFTPGRKLTEPHDLLEAMARPVTGSELVRCFGCHTTASTINDKFQRAGTIPGITCEACHGPGVTHVFAEEAGQGSGGIFNPGKLSPVDAVDFCGACHGTYWDIKLANTVGVANVRAQPYRLEKSRCWGTKGDARLACVACHDPHQNLVRDSASYDNKCLSCHVSDANAKLTADHPGQACKVAAKNCSSCHMPKFENPGMHFTFTDHDIRIVRAGESYPD